MAYDKTQKLGKSLIQHGKYNDRVYLMKLKGEDKNKVLDEVERLAKEKNYGKIFAKVREEDAKTLKENAFISEATIPNFFNGKTDGEFFSKYLKDERRQEDMDTVVEILTKAFEKQVGHAPRVNPNLTIEEVGTSDAQEIAQIYEDVFKTYPFPIFEPDYLKECIESDDFKIYAAIHRGEIAGLSTCEIDHQAENVEMTDFATRPEYRKQGIAQTLLQHMEKEMTEEGIKTAYTIARSQSPGMNITFSRTGYQYGGTLINNTNISGDIESMNVWYKPLKKLSA